MLNQPLSFHSTINVYITYFHNTLYVSLFTTSHIIFVHKRVRIVSFLENLFYYFASFYLFIYILSWSQFNGNKKKLRLWLMIHLIESRPMSVIFLKIICINVNDVNVFDCGNFFYISGKYNMFSSKLSTLSNFNKNKLFYISQFCWIHPLYNEL